MQHAFYVQLSIIALVLCCGFALWKGAEAERAGALLIISAWLATLAVSAFIQSYLSAMAFLVSDAVVAIGFLALSLRYSSWWMGAAMLVQAVGLGLHAAYFTADRTELDVRTLDLYVLGKNLASVLMLVILLAATIASVVERRRRTPRQGHNGPLAVTPSAG